MIQGAKLRFSRKPSEMAFFKTVTQRVNQYFKTNGISKAGDWRLYLKGFVVFSLYVMPYSAMLIWGEVFTGFTLLMFGIMGFGLAGIGLSIMHDANHGSYFKNRRLNHFLSYILNFVGGNSLNWRIQHNVLHHSFTNVHDHDEDISPVGLVRFSPHDKRRKIHRFQHLYILPLYSLQTFFWILLRDYRQLADYQKRGLLKGHIKSKAWEWTKLFMTKLFYVAFIFILPVFLGGISIWMVIGGFMIMHAIAGLLLALIFQVAHVVEHTDFPTPNSENQIEENWAIHQMLTTANFAPKSRILSWYIGGLNYQIEHHLFPTVSHIHYKKISGIVRETAKEFNVPYYSEPTFLSAIRSHFRLLRQLGRAA